MRWKLYGSPLKLCSSFNKCRTLPICKCRSFNSTSTRTRSGDSLSEIPGAITWSKTEEIEKGWSNDKKYYIETVDGRRMLLRMSDASRYDRYKFEFESLKKLDGKVQMNMSRPIDIGICNQGQSVYSLFTWVDGEDAREIIPRLSNEEQYRLGFESGVALSGIHEIEAENPHSSWTDYYNSKIDRYIQNYKSCGIHLDGADNMISYVEENRYLLEGRPISMQHGDYHIGNMVISEDIKLGIIDFNRLDYGDPWEEFNRITWCSEVSSHFASGRIHGYFNNDVPEQFFKLMALYIASNQLSSISWAVPFGEEQVQVMLSRAQDILREYDGFRSFVPSWYIPSFN